MRSGLGGLEAVGDLGGLLVAADRLALQPVSARDVRLGDACFALPSDDAAELQPGSPDDLGGLFFCGLELRVGVVEGGHGVGHLRIVTSDVAPSKYAKTGMAEQLVATFIVA